MEEENFDNWLHEFICNEDFSDEAIYAVYHFLEQVLMQFEIKAFYRLRRYAKKQEEINRCPYDFNDNEPPF